MKTVDNPVNDLIKYIISTKEFKGIVGEHIPEIVDEWAGKSKFKKFISRRIGKNIRKSFIKKDGETFSSLLKNKDFIETVTSALPEIINTGITGVDIFSSSLKDLPGEEKNILTKNLISKIDVKGVGSSITNLSILFTKIHETEPDFFTKTLQPKVRDLIETTDFGELRDLVDSSKEDMKNFVIMVNEELWKYPAKVILIFSFLPSLANLIIMTLKETITPINKIAPDLLADIVITLIKDIDGKDIGVLINEISEILRKIDTGSALIGEPGEPALISATLELIDDAVSEIDAEILIKGKVALIKIKSIFLDSFIEILGSNPELSREFFRSRFKSNAASIKRFAIKGEAMLDLFNDEEIADNIKEYMTELEPQDVSDIITNLASNMNTFYNSNPEMFREILTNVVDSTDIDELEFFIKNLVPDIVESVKPVSNQILPPIINGIADLLAPDDDNGEEINDALKKLKNILSGEEVKA